MAAEYSMDYLGALPLNMKIRLQADSGKPTVVADPDGEVAAHLQGRGAPGGGEDRRQDQGLLEQVPDHQDLEEHLSGSRRVGTGSPSGGTGVPAQPKSCGVDALLCILAR